MDPVMLHLVTIYLKNQPTVTVQATEAAILEANRSLVQDGVFALFGHNATAIIPKDEFSHASSTFILPVSGF